MSNKVRIIPVGNRDPRSFRKTIGNSDFSFIQHIPDLFNIHKTSFDEFLQPDALPHKRKNVGLERVFRSFFPIEQSRTNIMAEYLYYEITPPQFDPAECKHRSINYESVIKVTLKLTEKTTQQSKNIVCNMGGFPTMTDDSVFIINGHERVFVTTVQKCPGVMFLEDIATDMKRKCVAKIHPFIGSWIYIGVRKNTLYVTIDKKQKIPFTDFMLCFAYGAHDEQVNYGRDINNILDNFYKKKTVFYKNDQWYLDFNSEHYKNTAPMHNVYVNEDLVCQAHQLLNKTMKIDTTMALSSKEIVGLFLAEDIYDPKTGIITWEVGTPLTPKLIEDLQKKGQFQIYEVDDLHPIYVLNSLQVNRITTRDAALKSWAEASKIGSHYSPINLSNTFISRFSDPRYYSLDTVGRTKINHVLGLNKTEDHITYEDIIRTAQELIKLQDELRKPDDVDDFKNRRLKPTGNIVNEFILRGMRDFVKNATSRSYNWNSDNSYDTFNFKIITYRFISGFTEKSQVAERTNILSYGDHQRRTNFYSGTVQQNVPQGVYNLYASQTNRICPVRTPEGKKTGLVMYLALYAKLNNQGFLLTPYYTVKNGITTDHIVWLTAMEEDNQIIASKYDYEFEYDSEGNIITFTSGYPILKPKKDYILARYNEDFGFYHKESVNYVSIADNQIFSLCCAFITFIEYIDPYRALVAANMLCQALPLAAPEAPFVGTGMESVIGDKIISKTDGVVIYVSAEMIIIESTEGTEDESLMETYYLKANESTNANTCFTQKPLVYLGDVVKKGDVIGDGFCTVNGEVAVGKNILVAYMSNKYGYEDAKYVSEELLCGGLTSIHSETLTTKCLETRFGYEKITRSIPGFQGKDICKLDEHGFINVGEFVDEGEPIVGKRTPTGNEDSVTEEDKMVRSIFGIKASDSVDSSLRIPAGSSGTITDVKILTRKGVEKDGRTMLYTRQQVDDLNKKYLSQIPFLQDALINRLNKVLVNSPLHENYLTYKKNSILVIDRDFLKQRGSFDFVKDIPIKQKELLAQIVKTFQKDEKKLLQTHKEKTNTLAAGYSLAPGVLKVVNVSYKYKRNIRAGDKICGRYGNKGVISNIVPRADMPHLADGTPVQILISSLGILARMNIGQILETTVGYAIYSLRNKIGDLYWQIKTSKVASKTKELFVELRKAIMTAVGKEDLSLLNLNTTVSKATEAELLMLAKYFIEKGIHIRVSQFTQITEDEMNQLLTACGANTSGKVDLYDGRTGEKYHGQILVGYEFILKLVHMVASKVHARSVGPYGLVVSQPLGGKSRNGGQRAGEMEVWALEAYGSALNIFEFLNIKSDDIEGRKKAYKALSDNETFSLMTNIDPVSVNLNGKRRLFLRRAGFSLLMSELKGVGLIINMFMGEEPITIVSGSLVDRYNEANH